MLDQTNYWMNIAGAALDALLLARVLLLKLQRVYVFITLACVLTFLFDVIDVWLWSDSETRFRVFLYSRFLFAFVFPLVGWDVFEEVKSEISKLRKIALGRLISGLFFATIFGFFIFLFAAPSDENGQPGLLATLGVVAWAGSAAATLALLWTLQRAMRAQNIARPHNTAVWIIFWELALLGELVSCFCSLIVPFFKNQAADILTLILLTYGIVITAWCILKLRAAPSGVPSAPANANL